MRWSADLRLCFCLCIVVGFLMQWLICFKADSKKSDQAAGLSSDVENRKYCVMTLQLQKHAAWFILFICLLVWFLFHLWFNVSVNNFSAMPEHSHPFLGIIQYYGELMCLAQRNNSASLGFKPRTCRRPTLHD